MGTSSTKERYERAAKTGTLTVNDKNIQSWPRVVRRLSALEKLRSMTVSGTRIADPIPVSFVKLSLWGSLAYLDLSDNQLICACVLGYAHGLPKEHDSSAAALVKGNLIAAPPADAGVPLPLESLTLSSNRLHMLPPHLSTRFPRLRRLVCTNNAIPLTIPFSLARCLGPSASLEVIDLQRNQLTTCVVADASTEAPFPRLRELLLGHNHLSGTLTLGLREDHASPTFAQLRRISVDAQCGATPLQAVDPTIFVHCPGLTSLSLSGNPAEEDIHLALGKSAVYRLWQEKQASIISKKMNTGGNAELMR